MRSGSSTEKSPKELERFGFSMTLTLTILSGVLLASGREAGLYTAVLAGVFLFPAVFGPRALRPVEGIFAAVAAKVGFAITSVILILTFYLALAPLAVIAKICGKRFLGLKPEAERDTYWEGVDSGGSPRRYYTPY